MAPALPWPDLSGTRNRNIGRSRPVTRDFMEPARIGKFKVVQRVRGCLITPLASRPVVGARSAIADARDPEALQDR
ncbi:hypothetical protein C4E04_09245 [Microvirga sp. 17 mud 1-3]|nr:hypothetical protein C4E04_09245 [Microvirga sp. 17 mud 1-3]